MGIVKPSKVSFADEKIKKAWESLDKNDEIYKQLEKAKRNIEENAFCGRAVIKKLIPKIYKQYDNLWIYDLPSGWRLLYTITTPNKIQIISVILKWIDHKEYVKLFKF
jgi:hypothetical protein